MAEEQPNSIADISPEDWAATPESVKRLVTNLVEQLGELDTRVETLERQQEEMNYPAASGRGIRIKKEQVAHLCVI